VLVSAVLVVAPEPRALRPLRALAFDAYQTLAPRTRLSGPAVVVDVDDASLARYGQWPWPRTLLVELLGRIAQGEPAAIGVDMLLPEPDRLSPDNLARIVPGIGPDLARRLGEIEGHDAGLARALAAGPTVLGVAGVDDARVGAGPMTQRAPIRTIGGDPRRFVRHFRAAVQSIEILRNAAADQGVLNGDPDGRVVRRVPLIATVGETLVPSFGLALLRVATATPVLTVRVGARGVRAVVLGDLAIPTQPDGTVWLRFTRHDPARFVSAADVLDGRVDPGRFTRKMVIVGVTAVGLGDHHPTPVATSMGGPEIHAQLLESIFDGDRLRRPVWAPWAETLFTAVGGLAVIVVVPRLAAHVALVGTMAGVVLLAPALGFAAYRYAGLLLDPVVPATCLLLVFTLVLGASLRQAQRQRRALREQLERERLAAARIAGELEAARTVQLGMLPAAASAFPGETRFGLYAYLDPAREVGGDLYDFFLLDARRLFFLIGDVSGKGVAGSVFMAISRALCKSIALQRQDVVNAIVDEANVQMSRDNPEAFFVTACAGILDADTGVLTYCNAGHEAPLVLSIDGTVRPLTEGGGPPLCVKEDFRYAAAIYAMRPGETVCLVTDGVTEAIGAGGAFYGRARLVEVLAGLTPGADAAGIGDAVRNDVERFAGGDEQADDMAILVVRWNGPAAPAGDGLSER
jgi:adenylate cyclase